MIRVLILLGLALMAQSYSFSERNWKFLLPKDVIQELIELDANSTSDPVGVDQSIDTILRNQSRQVLDHLDLPPYYERLPFVQRWQIKDILFDKQLSYQQKHQMIYDLIHKLSPEQQLFPAVNNAQHSRYFEAFSTLQYQISFTFKLSELKRALPPRDMQSILHALGNHQLNIENKLAEIDRVMTQQSYDILDRLFFTGVPIVDAEARERFRRLFVEKGFWSMPQQVVQKLTPIHPNCILKPWCNLKYGPKAEEGGLKQPRMDQQQADSLPTPAPITQNQEAPQHSILIEVQSGNSKPIKQEFSVDPSSKMQTIVVESQQIEVDGRMLPKVNVFVHKNNESVESKVDEDGKMESIESIPLTNRNIKVVPQLKNPTLNIPWQLPHFIQSNQPNQPNRVSNFNEIQETTDIPTTKQPSTQTSSPTRWSITRNGPWTRQDERAFLQKWYQHFGIALSNPGFGTKLKADEKVEREKTKDEEKSVDTNFKAMDSVTDKPSSKMSPTGEAHFEVLRLAHEKVENEKKPKESKIDEDSKEKESQSPKKEVINKAFDDQNVKSNSDKVNAAIMSPTIKPPTVVINKEAKEKLVVRHSLKGSTLHLEKMTSSELRDTDNSTESSKNKPDLAENDDTNKLLQHPLNDTGSDLLDSLAESSGTGDKAVKSEGTKKNVEVKEVPSGLLKLRDVLRRLRERIRQSQSLKNSTFTWQNTE